MQPSFFINHGGGPCFFLEPGPMRRAWAPLEDYLAGFAARLPRRPDALVVISGHCEDRVPRIHFGGSPSLLYDYGGFPPHTYALEWPAPGSPTLAARIATLLDDAGIETARETARGWDHGVFVPLKIAFPNAEIPVVQLSLRQDLDPEAHLALGRALAPLRAENVLIIGSGQSYHNIGLAASFQERRQTRRLKPLTAGFRRQCKTLPRGNRRSAPGAMHRVRALPTRAKSIFSP